jgi:hypothetical protein
MLVPDSEYGREIEEIWAGVLPVDGRIAGMTLFGDLLIETCGATAVLRLSWLTLEEVDSVIEEVQWQLEAPLERGADWACPVAVSQLPERTLGSIYHFVQPLGLGGGASAQNVQLLSISQAHQGMRKLWNQLNAA